MMFVSLRKIKTMKYLIIFIFFLSNLSYGQIISGEIVDEGRKVLNKPAFVIEGMTNGYAKYELSVDREGNVTSARKVKSDIRMAPAHYEIKNYLNKFQFEKGTYFPKFHYVIVKITMVKKKMVVLDEID